MRIEISQMFLPLNHSQMTKKLHTSYHSCFHVNNVVGTSEILYLKMKGKTLRNKIKKSVQITLGFCFIHGKFLKSLGYVSSQNILYSKLKLNISSLLELFVEFSQFLSGATKVSNKIRAV